MCDMLENLHHMVSKENNEALSCLIMEEDVWNVLRYFKSYKSLGPSRFLLHF